MDFGSIRLLESLGIGSSPISETLKYCRLAQLVEHFSDKEVAAGSSPASTTILARSSGVEHLTVNQGVVGSNPTGSAIAGVAHLVERQSSKLEAVGSKPIPCSNG
jgi:hypothetical protein